MYGENRIRAAGENAFCWYKEGLTLRINFQGILIILKKLPNVVNLAPVLGARESNKKLKIKLRRQAQAASRQAL